MFDLWWKTWHWDTFLSEFLGLPQSISFHRGSPHSYIIWGMNNRPAAGGGRSSETVSQHRHEQQQHASHEMHYSWSHEQNNAVTTQSSSQINTTKNRRTWNHLQFIIINRRLSNTQLTRPLTNTAIIFITFYLYLCATATTTKRHVSRVSVKYKERNTCILENTFFIIRLTAILS
jgi:hypothetical protein